VLSILVYGYATGVFSRRKSDRRSVTHHASAGGGFEQGYNALAAMAADSLLVVAIDPGLRWGKRGAGGERQAADRADGGEVEDSA
jgi:hypothetical protein